MNDFAEKGNFYVLYPEQPTSRNANRCFNWYVRACMRLHDKSPFVSAIISNLRSVRFCVQSLSFSLRFEPSSQARNGDNKDIAEMTSRVISQYNLSKDQVFVAGISAGAAQAVLISAGTYQHTLT